MAKPMIFINGMKYHTAIKNNFNENVKLGEHVYSIIINEKRNT